MSVRDAVRDAQRRLAALDATYNRAVATLEKTIRHRNDVLAQQDRVVANAESDVRRAVAEMVTEFGTELTATVLGLETTEVRRLARGSGATGRDEKAQEPRVGVRRRPDREGTAPPNEQPGPLAAS
jgi:hypothetical protein